MAEIGVDIDKARKLLDQGQLVAIPTETVYGLAGNALNPDTVSQIFAVKKRPFFDPLIVHVSDLNQLEELVEHIPESARQLAEKFWPGPLTLVLPKRSKVPDLVTGGLNTVAVRLPGHPMTRKLLQTLSFPLAAPSANPFGYISPTTVQHVQDQLGDEIPYILDGGDCQVGIESTIVAFEQNQPIIYRQGGIPREQISSLIGAVKVIEQKETPRAPGMLRSHYAPGKPLYLGNIPELLQRFKDQPIGLLTLHKHYSEVPDDFQIQLSASGNLNEAAKNLFAALRKLDGMSINFILAEPVPTNGLGPAINDRLRRAAT